MADCPLADECPSFQERIEGMGCTHYGDRGGKEWCKHYNQPIQDLKTQPVKPQEEIVVTVDDIHESGAGIGRTEDGFIVFVDGVLPEARAKVKITQVYSNHARAEEVERLPLEPEDGDEGAGEDESDDAGAEGDEAARKEGDEEPERLGSRDNFWGS